MKLATYEISNLLSIFTKAIYFCLSILTKANRQIFSSPAIITKVMHNDGEILLEKRFKLYACNTVYQAELSGIDKAIDWFCRTDFKEFHIYTDSLSSIQALQNLFPTDKILYNIYSNLILLSDKVIFMGWIKSHIGLAGNERADYLTNSVILDDEFDERLDIPIPVSFLKRFYKNNIITMWTNDWKISEKGRDTFLILRSPDVSYLCY